MGRKRREKKRKKTIKLSSSHEEEEIYIDSSHDGLKTMADGLHEAGNTAFAAKTPALMRFPLQLQSL